MLDGGAEVRISRHVATVLDVYRKHKPDAFQADRRPSSREVWWWFFMRISGVILLFLVLIHLYIMHLVGSGVDRVNFTFVSQRWSSLGWKTFDWVLLVLALVHGVNGMRIIIDDYVRRAALRTAIKGTLYSLAAIALVMGTAVLVTFDAGAGG
jgi:succinate dehydrogenase / fumarate reductase, membrane anchor subunit